MVETPRYRRVMLASADVIAFVPTTDLDRARGFYEGVLGLPVTEDDGLALALNAHGTMLRVTTVRELTPAPYTVLGWSVASVAAVHDLAARGVVVARYEAFEQDEQGVWRPPVPGSPGSPTLTATRCSSRSCRADRCTPLLPKPPVARHDRPRSLGVRRHGNPNAAATSPSGTGMSYSASSSAPFMDCTGFGRC